MVFGDLIMGSVKKWRRVFCPLKKKWFDLIAQGKKIWEFRSAASPVGKQYLARSGSKFLIEFRRGYSGPSVLKVAVEVRIFSSPEKIPEVILRQGCVRPQELYELGITREVVGVRFKERMDKKLRPRPKEIKRETRTIKRLETEERQNDENLSENLRARGVTKC